MDWTPEKEAEYRKLTRERDVYRDGLKQVASNMALSMGLKGMERGEFVAMALMLDENGYKIARK